jgi:hypothetical protein
MSSEILFYCFIYFLDFVLQLNAETDDNVTPLVTAVAAGSLACVELLIQVLYFSSSSDILHGLCAYAFYAIKEDVYICH